MPEFKLLPNANPAFKSSQETVDLLEQISAVDMASTVPFIKISRVKQGNVDKSVKSLNLSMQKPPDFGSSMADHERYGERPAVSLNKLSVRTEQNYGEMVISDVTIDITVHRPDAFIFEKNKIENLWISLIVPGNSHIIEYGWKGASKNPLINGEGFDDQSAEDFEKNPVIIDSTSSILVTTYYYTFSFNESGELLITIKCKQNGDYALRKAMFIRDSLIKRDEIKEAGSDGFVPLNKIKTDIEEKRVREAIANRIKEFPDFEIKKANSNTTVKKKYIRLVDLLSVLEIDYSLEKLSKHWNYDGVDLIIGGFNDMISSKTSKKYGSINLRGKSIGEFLIPKDEAIKQMNIVARKGVEITIHNFLSSITGIVNRAEAWTKESIDSNDQKLSTITPTCKIKVAERKVKNNRETKKRLVVIIFDMKRELVNFQNEAKITKFDNDSQPKKKLKKILREKQVPYLTLGKANSFIQNANFEIINDSLIQSHKISEAATFSQDRDQLASETHIKSAEESPQKFHQIWHSTMQGTITMLGNFAFDTFAPLWIDFGIYIWDGAFNVRFKEDVISPGSFTTTLEIISEGSDPFNTKRRKSENDFAKERYISNLRNQRGKLKTQRAKDKLDEKIKEAEETDSDELILNNLVNNFSF